MNIRKERFLNAYIVSGTVEEAAKVAGIGRSTGYKYLHDCVTFSRNCGGMNDTATATKPSMATSSLRSFLMRLM